MTKRNAKDVRKGIGLGATSAIAWGVDTVIIGVIIASSPFKEATLLAPIIAAFMHDFFSSIWISLLMIIRGQFINVLKLLKTKSGAILMLGALSGGPLAMSFYFLGIQYAGVTYAASIASIFPGIGAVLAFFFLKEKMNKRTWSGVVLSIIGVIILAYVPTKMDAASNFFIGILFSLGAAIFWGLEGVISAWGMRGKDVEPLYAINIRQITSAFSYGIVIVPFLHGYPLVFEATTTSIVWVIAIAGFLGTANYSLYYSSINLIGAARGQSLNNTYVFWAIVTEILFIGTPINLQFIIGAIIVLFGSILVSGNIKK
ncbi:DMT family transporter [Sporosarcina pasteurii]|uniref:Carboxylate/amino acid/amine transporter n=1 Tax=Sporosarcina pasteurii TaxID=1474 RepID=A0A380BLU9_SPOPA|nr:DMT family transporter [Sporosarcina pasteurii]MDS9470948.1 DMT family transporter [Sporosarcina pasteurii]QBQ05398.1 DMT family transporter [Sporosarcina pasteurii]SUJ03426.1 carboxylate/amino acid/amine transporter [Sporosarcina pasteurii]